MRGQLLARGRTAEVLEWDDGRVAKVFYGWCSAEWIEREARVAAQMSDAGLPVPRCFGTLELDGRKGIVYERLTGPSMLHAMSAAPWKFGAFARDLARLHLMVNRQPGLELPQLVGYLRRSIQTAEGLAEGQRTAALSILHTLPAGDRLCHFDFHPDQVILTRDGPRIIDWLTAFRGEPAADVARTWMLLQLGSVEHLSRAVRTLAKLARGRLTRRYLSSYAQGSGRDVLHQARRWRVAVLAARLTEKVPGEQKQILEILDREIRQGNA